MEPALIDTNIASMFLRGHPEVRSRFAAYVGDYGKINLSIITVYEALSGLKHRDAKKQTTAFRALVAASEVWPLTEQSVEHSAEMYAALRKSGQTIDDIDLLIAGIAAANGFVLVTNNRKHFDRSGRSRSKIGARPEPFLGSPVWPLAVVQGLGANRLRGDHQ